MGVLLFSMICVVCSVCVLWIICCSVCLNVLVLSVL